MFIQYGKSWRNQETNKWTASLRQKAWCITRSDEEEVGVGVRAISLRLESADDSREEAEDNSAKLSSSCGDTNKQKNKQEVVWRQIRETTKTVKQPPNSSGLVCLLYTIQEQSRRAMWEKPGTSQYLRMKSIYSYCSPWTFYKNTAEAEERNYANQVYKMTRVTQISKSQRQCDRSKLTMSELTCE